MYLNHFIVLLVIILVSSCSLAKGRGGNVNDYSLFRDLIEVYVTHQSPQSYNLFCYNHQFMGR